MILGYNNLVLATIAGISGTVLHLCTTTPSFEWGNIAVVARPDYNPTAGQQQRAG